MAPQPTVDLGSDDLAKVVRVLQVVTGAILASQIMFLAIVLAVRQMGAPPAIPDSGILVGVGSLLTATALAIAILMTNRLVRLQDAAGDRILRVKRASGLIIVRLAILEGAGIANIVFFLLTAELPFLGALAVGLLAIIIFRPTREYFETFRDRSGMSPTA